jgi:hypothetical protein
MVSFSKKGTKEPMEKYNELIAAIEILTKALRQHDMSHPSWDIVFDAKKYLLKQADAVMRGVTTDEEVAA